MFLRALAGAKLSGSILELGTGIGVSTAWLLDGADKRTTLDTVDSDERCSELVRSQLGGDERLTVHCTTGDAFITANHTNTYDLIFADMPFGKYQALDEMLALVKQGGFYVVDHVSASCADDDLRVLRNSLIDTLQRRSDFHVVTLECSSGLVLATKKATSFSLL